MKCGTKMNEENTFAQYPESGGFIDIKPEPKSKKKRPVKE